MQGTLLRGPKDGAVIKHVPDCVMETGNIYTEIHATPEIDVIYVEPGEFPKARYELTNPQGGDPVFCFVEYSTF